MPGATLQVSGVYVRYWRITIPAMDAADAPKLLLKMLLESPDFQAPIGDDQIIASPSNWFVGCALILISGNIKRFGPKAVPPTAGVPISGATAYIPGGANTNGALWNPTTQGDWTENCTETMQTAWFCSDTNGTPRTATLKAYLKQWPMASQNR